MRNAYCRYSGCIVQLHLVEPVDDHGLRGQDDTAISVIAHPLCRLVVFTQHDVLPVVFMETEQRHCKWYLSSTQ